MFSAVLCLVALVGCAAAYDDGQWHPELDGSILGSGFYRYGLDDGQWKPELDGSFLGRGDLTWLHRRKRDLLAVSPHALSTPLEDPVNALAKTAHHIQWNTEATRNILGGGFPLHLPADTPAVAAAKQAHAIAYDHQTRLTAPHLYSRFASPIHHYAAAPYSYGHTVPTIY
ncbi:hypothetical protein GE061_014742 [Apolygus lucorum]|uniref:Uncharacterized protein n=1 Tax=Apolygus lucorum TaxID=248454 RepID=A0A8S9XK70_APOLU|nr:hypothetical protein GE061_014742 [Apolygus lucorum]